MKNCPPIYVMLSAPKGCKAQQSIIRLAGEIAGSDARWVQVAVEGEFLGYTLPNGQQGFEFTREIFDEVVANIKGHPSFNGTEGIVPWDFDHASASPSTSGARPMVGAPSVGWSSDAEVRAGSGGKSELWMLTEFAEPARGYVKSGQYKWASVVLNFSSIDKVTGKPSGALVSSIALTNRPFIEGMEQLVAASADHSRAPATGQPASAEENRMDLLKLLAGILNVGATQDAVTAELESLTGLRDKLVALFSVPANRATVTAILQEASDAQAGALTLGTLVTALSAKDGGEAATKITALMKESVELGELKPKLVTLMAAQKEIEDAAVKLDVDRALASNAAFTEAHRAMFTLSRTSDKEAFLTQYPADTAPAAPGIPPATAALTTSVAATPGGTQLQVQAGGAPIVAPAANPVAGMTVQNGQVMLGAPPAVQAVAPATGQLGGQVVNLATFPGVNDPQRMIAYLSQTRQGFKDQSWDDQFESAMLALDELKKAAA